jgi:hypothetical protein
MALDLDAILRLRNRTDQVWTDTATLLTEAVWRTEAQSAIAMLRDCLTELGWRPASVAWLVRCTIAQRYHPATRARPTSAAPHEVTGANLESLS